MLPGKTSITENFWKELEKSGLIPDSSSYKTVRSIITEFGTEEADNLQKELGSRGFDRIISTLHTKYPKEDLIRILGFGHAITLYLVLPVTRYQRIKKETIELGARANLIVSLFDHMVDSGKRISRVLSEKDLESMIDKREMKINGILSSYTNPEKWTMTVLISSYLKKLNNLNPDPGNILHLQISLIRSMFMAELNTLNKAEENPLLLRRKTALPFMVMGIPSWFDRHDTGSFNGYYAHLIWLYRLGLFIGAIDDIIDIHEDIRNNHPNQFKKYYTTQEADLLSGELLKIISAGRTIKETWDKKVSGNDPCLPDFSRDILGTCIVSWYGGIKNYQHSKAKTGG